MTTELTLTMCVKSMKCQPSSAVLTLLQRIGFGMKQCLAVLKVFGKLYVWLRGHHKNCLNTSKLYFSTTPAPVPHDICMVNSLQQRCFYLYTHLDLKQGRH